MYNSKGCMNVECPKIEDSLYLISLCYISILIPTLYQSFNYFRSANHSTHEFIICIWFCPTSRVMGRGVDHPTPFRAEVNERVELHFYSKSGPSWHFVR
jgi:hypothetical protein